MKQNIKYKIECNKDKSFYKLFIFIVFFISFINNSFTQNDTSYYRIEDLQLDTISSEQLKIHSPKRAALYSAVIPGLGQIYNKKYWKLPIVYATVGTATYFAIDFHKEFLRYKNAYIIRDKGGADEFSELSSDALINEMDRWTKYRDLCIAATALFYLLNILDASVDAYLFDFDVSDNISINLSPPIPIINNNFNNQPLLGMKISIKF